MSKLYLYSTHLSDSPYVIVSSEALSTQQKLNLVEDGCTMLTGTMLVISDDYKLLKEYSPKDLTFWRIMNYEANGVVSDKLDLNLSGEINHRLSSKDNTIENLTWRNNYEN